MAKTHFGYQDVEEEEKEGRVAAVFDSVASRYDVMNDVMSFGIHRLWKEYFVWQAEPKPGEVVLDLAAGTGDISRRLAKRMMCEGRLQGELWVSDINASMLKIGRNRLLDQGLLHNVHYVLANAECLPFHDESVDLITMAFGLRNITHQEKALSEMARVLKPNGRVLILEFSHVKSKCLEKLYDFYSFNFLPLMGRLVAKDAESYRYLAESIRMMPTQERLCAMMEEAGFVSCEFKNLNQGIVAVHRGVKGV